MNEATLKGALTTVESFVGGVGRLVAEGVSRCKDRVQQQEALCLQDKESVLQLLVRTFNRPDQRFYAIFFKRLFLTGYFLCFCRRSIDRTWRRSWWLAR